MTDKRIELMIHGFTLNHIVKGLKTKTVKRKVSNIEKLIQYLEE